MSIIKKFLGIKQPSTEWKATISYDGIHVEKDEKKESEEWVWVNGYKGTDKDMKCRDFQYEMHKQIDYIFESVLAGRCAGVFGDADEIGVVSDYKKRNYRNDHSYHEFAERQTRKICHQQHAGIGRKRAFGNMAKPAGDKRLLTRFQIAFGGILHNIAAEDHGCCRGQKADEHGGNRRVDAPVMEEPV